MDHQEKAHLITENGKLIRLVFPREIYTLKELEAQNLTTASHIQIYGILLKEGGFLPSDYFGGSSPPTHKINPGRFGFIHQRFDFPYFYTV